MRHRSLLLEPIQWPRAPRRDVGVALGLFAVAIFFFRGAILGHGVLFRRDISLVWYPQVESFVRCIAMGSWPLWDPYRSFGQPLLADPSAEILYPFTWMNLVAPPWIVYTCFVVVHLGLSGVGMYVLARRLSVSRAGAFTGALAWIASGPFLSLASTWHHMAGAAWIPWVFLAAEVTLARGNRRAALLWGSAIAAQILAGSADMVAMTLVATTVYAGMHHCEWTRPLSVPNLRCATIAVLALAFGLALSAAQWLPTLEMARNTTRLGLDVQERTTWSVHPLVMLETVLPFHWDQLPLTPRSVVDLLERREPWLHSIYLGVPLLALAVAGATRAGRKGALVLLAAGGALVALGRHSPIYGVVVWLLPPLRILRFPVKAMVIAAFALALLAGMGFDEWRRDPGRRGRRWQVAVVGPVAFLTLGAVAALVFATLAAPWWAPGILVKAPSLPSYTTVLAPTAKRFFFATCVAGAILFLGSRRALSGPVQAAAMSVALLLDLGAAHRDLHPVAPKTIFTHRPEVLASLDSGELRRVYVYDYSTLPKSRRNQANEWSPFRLASIPPGWTPLQALTFAALTYLTPPTAARWGISGSYDLDLLGLQPQPLVDLNEFLRQQEGTPIHTRLLQMASVANVVDLAPPSRWPDLGLVAEVPGLFLEPVRVYRVPDPLPHAYVVGGAVTADGPAALATLARPEFSPRQLVLLGEEPHVTGSNAPPGSARVVDSRADRLVVAVDLSAPGYLVVTDTYDPGWRVWVDGSPARLLRANVAFRAVEVPRGVHEVVFRYRPASVLLGVSISAAALAFAVALSLSAWRAQP